jgi:hypothetical protein
LVIAGHRVSLVCTKPTAELFHRDGTVVTIPIKGWVPLLDFAEMSRYRRARSCDRRRRICAYSRTELGSVGVLAAKFTLSTAIRTENSNLLMTVLSFVALEHF